MARVSLFSIVKSESPVPILMGQSLNLRMRWKTKIVVAYTLAFAVLAITFDFLPLAFAGSSSTIASASLSTLRTRYLPMGWVLLGLTKPVQLEVGLITSVFLAFMVCFPIIAYTVVRLISPPNLSKRTFNALVLGAAVIFYQGATLGLVLNHFYIISLAPSFGPIPEVAGYAFYVSMLQGILSWAVIFIAPIYLVSLFELRRAHGLRWHL
jgi:hypothetical protein